MKFNAWIYDNTNEKIKIIMDGAYNDPNHELYPDENIIYKDDGETVESAKLSTMGPNLQPVNSKIFGDPLPFLLDPDEKVKSWIDMFVIPTCENLVGNSETMDKLYGVKSIRLPWSPMTAPKTNVLYNPTGLTRFAHILLIGDLPEKIILQTSLEKDESTETESGHIETEKVNTITRTVYMARAGQFWYDRDFEKDKEPTEEEILAIQLKWRNAAMTALEQNSGLIESQVLKQYEQYAKDEIEKLKPVKGACVSLYVDWRYFYIRGDAELVTVGPNNSRSNENRLDYAFRKVGLYGKLDNAGIQPVSIDMGKAFDVHDIIGSWYDSSQSGIMRDVPEYKELVNLFEGGFYTGNTDSVKDSCVTISDRFNIARFPQLDALELNKTSGWYYNLQSSQTDDQNNILQWYDKEKGLVSPETQNEKDYIPVMLEFPLSTTDNTGVIDNRIQILKVRHGLYYVNIPRRRYKYSTNYIALETQNPYRYYERGELADGEAEEEELNFNTFCTENEVKEYLLALGCIDKATASGVALAPGYHIASVQYDDPRDPGCNAVNNTEYNDNYHDAKIDGEYSGYRCDYFTFIATPNGNPINTQMFIDVLYELKNVLRIYGKNGLTVYNRGTGIPFSVKEGLKNKVLIDHTLSYLGCVEQGNLAFREFAQSVHRGFTFGSFPINGMCDPQRAQGHILGRVVGNSMVHTPYKSVNGVKYDSFGNQVSYPNPSYYDGTFDANGTEYNYYCVNLGWDSVAGHDEIIKVAAPLQTGSDDVIDIDRLVTVSRNARTGVWEIITAQCNE